jgi:hypothetical protein
MILQSRQRGISREEVVTYLLMNWSGGNGKNYRKLEDTAGRLPEIPRAQTSCGKVLKILTVSRTQKKSLYK